MMQEITLALEATGGVSALLATPKLLALSLRGRNHLLRERRRRRIDSLERDLQVGAHDPVLLAAGIEPPQLAPLRPFASLRRRKPAARLSERQRDELARAPLGVRLTARVVGLPGPREQWRTEVQRRHSPKPQLKQASAGRCDRCYSSGYYWSESLSEMQVCSQCAASDAAARDYAKVAYHSKRVAEQAAKQALHAQMKRNDAALIKMMNAQQKRAAQKQVYAIVSKWSD